MSNEVAEFNKAGNFLAGADAFEAAKPKVNSGGMGDYLKLRSSDGVWVYGKDEVEVEDGARLAINPNSLRQGFIAWKAGRPIGEEMAVIGEPPVNPADLHAVDCQKGWEEQVGFDLAIISGEDEGTQVLWNSNNRGGKLLYGKIFDAIKARAVAGKPHIPIIELDFDFYVHSEHGKIYDPIMKIVEWSGDGATAIENDGEEPAAEEAAPKRRRRAG